MKVINNGSQIILFHVRALKSRICAIVYVSGYVIDARGESVRTTKYLLQNFIFCQPINVRIPKNLIRNNARYYCRENFFFLLFLRSVKNGTSFLILKWIYMNFFNFVCANLPLLLSYFLVERLQKYACFSVKHNFVSFFLKIL